jgi:hypothetical protein
MRKSESDSERAHARRAFLKGVVIGGGAAVVALAAGKAPAKSEPQPATAATAPRSAGYHVTDHIRDYYRTASV